MSGEQQCSRCKELKQASEFGPDSRRKAGIKNVCRACDREIHRLHYQNKKVRERVKEASRIQYEIYAKDRLAERRASGICQFCPNPSIPGTTRCEHHAKVNRQRVEGYRKSRSSEGLCQRCGKNKRRKRFKTCADCAAKASEYNKNHPSKPLPKEHRNAVRKAWYRKVREEVLEHYGAKCVCCGETNKGFLTIDHINNDGHKHRKAIFRRQTGTLYSWIKGHEFPDDLQILCYNCNCGRAKHGGVCPHKLTQQQEAESVSLLSQQN